MNYIRTQTFENCNYAAATPVYGKTDQFADVCGIDISLDSMVNAILNHMPRLRERVQQMLDELKDKIDQHL